MGIYRSIREEWKDCRSLEDAAKVDKQIAIAYKGLSQLKQFEETQMTGGTPGSPNWSVQLEQNPMPKPEDYDERKKRN